MNKQEFQRFILHWWETNKRDLPWRHTNEPYHILVSEIMLQQTQVSRVIEKYKEFLSAFPETFHLANASVSDVLRIWKGLGYNRRALYLQNTAKLLVHKEFPRDIATLQKFPGIGIYTSRAIAVFAFKQDVALVDTNIRQIITHFFFHDVTQKEKLIWDTATSLVPHGKAWEWHQALMDYGALELNKIKKLHIAKASRGKQKPFKNSNRYFRGRIIDYLRDERLHMNVLRGKFPDIANSKFSTIIDSLIADTLIEKKDNYISLPGDL